VKSTAGSLASGRLAERSTIIIGVQGAAERCASWWVTFPTSLRGGIREALKAFAPVGNIKLVKEKRHAVGGIEMEMSRPAADALGERIQGRHLQGTEPARLGTALDG